MKVVAIIQARMTSTRLPGKVLMQVQGKSLLEYQLERVKRSKFIDEIVVATTVNTSDDPIVKLCDKIGVSIYRGSEEDVLSRYYGAAIQFEADVIVRLTSDCPLIDSEIIDQVIKLYMSRHNGLDYVSNTLKRTYPRGLDTEAFSLRSLQTAYENAYFKSEREHVTPYIYMNSNKFNIENLSFPQNLSKHRWTVDTKEDFELIKLILESLYTKNPMFTMKDVLDLLVKNPSLFNINAHVEQKKI